MKKKLLLSVLSVFTLLFLSCSDNNDSGLEVTETAIVGAWNLTAFDITDGEISTTIGGITTVATLEGVGKDFDMVVNFSENPQTVTSEGSFNIVLSITTMGQTITEEQDGEDIFDATEWRLNGNSIIFGSGEEEVAFLITSLTDTEMNLQSEANSSTIEFSDTQIELNQKYTVKLTK
jgi:hypothetical protein